MSITKVLGLKINNVIYTSIINETLKEIEKFLSPLEDLIGDEYKVKYKENDNQIFIRMELNRFKNDSSFLEKMVKLVDSYLSLKLYHFNPLEIDFFPPLSSGQKALLSIFADISEVFDESEVATEKICSQIDTKENIILLLDEPDVYFHPEWQRLFIYFLTEFLKKKYFNKDFHVIISTHSPFMLSDTPKGNCVFLELEIKEDEKEGIQEYKTVVKPKEEIHNTLAQNIYYLLAEGFFMEKGIGEYINRRLKQFLEKINEGTLTSKEEQKFRELIGNIGDTVLKNKLFSILNNKEFYKGKLKR